MNTNGILYGKGIFSTIAVVEAKPFQWEKHWQRLREHSSRIGLDISGHRKDAVFNSLREQILENNLINGRARVTLIDGSQSSIWTSEPEKKVELLVMTAEMQQLPKFYQLTISPYRVNSTSPLAGIKSCNYLENILAIDEARSRGFNEAVRLNERGKITSGCMSNIFWLAKGKLFTPDLSTGCLAGTTRSYVLDNLECEEVRSEVEELFAADAIFLTSAGIGIKAVERLDAKEFKKIEHPLLNLLPY